MRQLQDLKIEFFLGLIEIYMKIKYKANFAGYICVLRSVQLLLTFPAVNFTLLGAYLAFVMQADFGKKNTNYEVILRDDYELAKEWQCSPSTVNRNRRALIKIGLLQEQNGLTKITNFSMFEVEMVRVSANITPQLLKHFFAKTVDEVAKIMEKIAEMEPSQLQKGLLSLDIPYKGKSEFINVTMDKDVNKKNIED